MRNLLTFKEKRAMRFFAASTRMALAVALLQATVISQAQPISNEALVPELMSLIELPARLVESAAAPTGYGTQNLNSYTSSFSVPAYKTVSYASTPCSPTYAQITYNGGYILGSDSANVTISRSNVYLPSGSSGKQGWQWTVTNNTSSSVNMTGYVLCGATTIIYDGKTYAAGQWLQCPAVEQDRTSLSGGVKISFRYSDCSDAMEELSPLTSGFSISASNGSPQTIGHLTDKSSEFFSYVVPSSSVASYSAIMSVFEAPKEVFNYTSGGSDCGYCYFSSDPHTLKSGYYYDAAQAAPWLTSLDEPVSIEIDDNGYPNKGWAYVTRDYWSLANGTLNTRLVNKSGDTTVTSIGGYFTY